MLFKGWHVGLAAGVGAAVGVTVCMAVLVVARTVDLGAYSTTEPGVTQWNCSGAEVLASAVLDDEGLVNVVVSLRDGQQRGWQVRVGSYSGVVARRPTQDGTYPVLWQESGDLDDGSVRKVAARVDGTDDWCSQAVSLT